MAPEIAPLYLLIQPNPVSSCREVKPGPVIVSRRRWLLKSVRRFEINEIHFFFLEGSLFLGPVCKQASAFPHLLEPTGMGFAGVFCTKGELRSPVTTGRALQRGLGFIVIFFFPSGAAGRKEQFKCKCCEQCRQCCAAPRPAMERWGGPMGGRTHGYMDGPMDIPMAPTYGAGIRLGFAIRSLLQHCLALHFAETSRCQNAKGGVLFPRRGDSAGFWGESFPVCTHICFSLEGKPPLPSQLRGAVINARSGISLITSAPRGGLWAPCTVPAVIGSAIPVPAALRQWDRGQAGLSPRPVPPPRHRQLSAPAASRRVTKSSALSRWGKMMDASPCAKTQRSDLTARRDESALAGC